MRKNILKQILTVVAIASCGLMFTTCLNPYNPADINEITFEGFSSGTATPSAPYTVSGTIGAESGIDSVLISVADPDGVHYMSQKFNGNGSTSYNLTYSVTVDVSTCNGNHTVNLIAFSEDFSGSKSVGITVSGAKDCSVPPDPSLDVGALSGSTAVTPSSPAALTAQVTCSNCTGISVQASVKVADSSGALVTDGSVTATASASGASTIAVRLSATTAACDGNYSVTLTVVAGTLIQTKTAAFTVAGAADCGNPITGDLTIRTGISLGAQNNALGSSLDIDTFAVLTSANAKAAAANVDCIAGYSLALDSIKLGSPKWAMDNALTVADGWALYNTTEFRIPLSSIDMATITEAALKTAWNGSAAGSSSISCAVGCQYMSVTSKGSIGVIEVTAVTNGIAGSVTVKIGKTRAGVETPPEPELPADSNLTVSATLNIGANENAALGSSIDLDVPVVMLAANAKTNAAYIDLVYANSFATNSDKLGSPDWAKDNVSFVTGWSTYNATKFYKLTGTTFESVTTVDQLKALWLDSKATASSIDVVANDVIIAKTEKGAIVLIKIISQVAGATGKIDIKVAK